MRGGTDLHSDPPLVSSTCPGPQGTPDAPRCGFSRKVVEALRAAGEEFGSFDILSDEGVRQGLKELSNWPTYPQVGRPAGALCRSAMARAAGGRVV